MGCSSSMAVMVKCQHTFGHIMYQCKCVLGEISILTFCELCEQVAWPFMIKWLGLMSTEVLFTNEQYGYETVIHRQLCSAQNLFLSMSKHDEYVKEVAIYMSSLL